MNGSNNWETTRRKKKQQKIQNNVNKTLCYVIGLSCLCFFFHVAIAIHWCCAAFWFDVSPLLHTICCHHHGLNAFSSMNTTPLPLMMMHRALSFVSFVLLCSLGHTHTHRSHLRLQRSDIGIWLVSGIRNTFDKSETNQ